MDDHFISPVKINCKELILIPELFGEGSIYCYEIFMYIFDDFVGHKHLDINNIFNSKDKYVLNNFNNLDKKIYNIHIYDHSKYKNTSNENLLMMSDEINDIFKKIKKDSYLYIIIPIPFEVKNNKFQHIVTVIYEIRDCVLLQAHIQNSGYGTFNHHHYYDDSKYLNYVYSIDINYIFTKSDTYINNKNNKNINIDKVIQCYLLNTFFNKITYIEDLYY